MKQNTTIPSGRLLLVLMAAFSVFIFAACNNSSKPNQATDEVKVKPLTTTNANATVRELWGGSQQTHANDSVKFYMSGDTVTAYTDSAGHCSFSINYTSGVITAEALANNEISGMVFNQAWSKLDQDTPLIKPTFYIPALGGTNDTIPVKVFVTDLTGAPRSGYTVQFQQGGSNYGTAGTTNSHGILVYSKGLSQTSSYTVTASGAAGTSSPLTVSTSPAAGSSGNFACIYVYIRY